MDGKHNEIKKRKVYFSILQLLPESLRQLHLSLVLSGVKSSIRSDLWVLLKGKGEISRVLKSPELQSALERSV
jgi:hypothetical protein